MRQLRATMVTPFPDYFSMSLDGEVAAAKFKEREKSRSFVIPISKGLRDFEPYPRARTLRHTGTRTRQRG